MNRTPHRRGSHREGFVLAFVLVLIMALSVMIVVLLQRQNAQMLQYKRQLDAYSMHHATAGFGEAIEAWLRNNGQTPLRQMVGPGGHAFDLSVDGGSPVRVSLYEAQGAALADLAGLPEEQISMGREILMRLQERLGDEAGRYTRTEGPLAISIRTAPPEVLLAAAETAMHEEGDPERFVELLIEAREQAGAEAVDLNKAILDGEVPMAARARIVQVLSGDTTLWRGTAEQIEPPSSFPQREPLIYEFWANIRQGRSRVSESAALERSTSILRWERMQGPSYR